MNTELSVYGSNEYDDNDNWQPGDIHPVRGIYGVDWEFEPRRLADGGPAVIRTLRSK